MKTKYQKIFSLLLGSVLLMSSCSEEAVGTADSDQERTSGSKNTVFAIKGLKESASNNRAAAVTLNTWNSGQTIKIKFIDNSGSAYARLKVEEYAKEWTKYANLKFEFVSSSTDADVKIAFNYQNSRVAWSLIGKKCIGVTNSSKKPSMNIPFYNDNDVNSEEFKAVVLREFGHALGLVFEHQGPNAKGLYDWNEGRLVTYFMQEGWEEDDIYDLIDIAYTTRQTKFTEFDENSIMLLYFPAFLTNNNKQAKWNTTLSDLDKVFISSLYPGKEVEEIPSTVALRQIIDNVSYKYNAVRIGEYLWMDANMYALQEMPHVNQHQINRSLWVLGIDTLNYKVTPEEYHKYIGELYSKGSRLGYFTALKMYETHDVGEVEKTWGLPTKKDFRQLFAMCGDGGNNDVLTTLSYKEGEIPLARKVQHNHWMHNNNTNKYGFNLIYSGFRQHNGQETWTNKENGNSITLRQGDVGQVFNMHIFQAADGIALLEDYPSTQKWTESYWWLPVRLTRRLTDAELGYKLYVNSDQTDIKKLGLTETAPAGYIELGNGYLRGFYVQYILNNENPTKTIADIKQMALNHPDVTHHGAPIL